MGAQHPTDRDAEAAKPQPMTRSATRSAGPSDSLIKRAQDKVAGITKIMRQNVAKVMRRQQSLEKLEKRAEALHDRSKQFNVVTHKVKRHYWWQTTDAALIVTTTAFISVCIIVLTILELSSDDDGN